MDNQLQGLKFQGDIMKLFNQSDRPKVFKTKRSRFRFYQDMIVAVIETLCSICLYIEMDAKEHGDDAMGRRMRSHFGYLKDFTETLRRFKK